MENIKRIEELWQEFRLMPFPKGYGGYEIEDINLSSLETYTAGCITSFISSRGALDIWRTSILGICYRDLTVVTRDLDNDALDFFKRLEIIAGLILEAIRDATKSTSPS